MFIHIRCLTPQPTFFKLFGFGVEVPHLTFFVLCVGTSLLVASFTVVVVFVFGFGVGSFLCGR